MERPEVSVGDFIILKGYEEDPGMEALIYKIEDDGILFVTCQNVSFQKAWALVVLML